MHRRARGLSRRSGRGRSLVLGGRLEKGPWLNIYCVVVTLGIGLLLLKISMRRIVRGKGTLFFTRSSGGDFTREERIAWSTKSNAKCACKGHSEMKKNGCSTKEKMMSGEVR